jgi:hypothetical protein
MYGVPIVLVHYSLYYFEIYVLVHAALMDCFKKLKLVCITNLLLCLWSGLPMHMVALWLFS